MKLENAKVETRCLCVYMFRVKNRIKWTRIKRSPKNRNTMKLSFAIASLTFVVVIYIKEILNFSLRHVVMKFLLKFQKNERNQ